MDPFESFPERLKNYRKTMGWRQNELAEQWNYSFDTISSWERGTRTPNTQEIPRLAKLLNIAAEELVKSIKLTHDKAHLHKGSAPTMDEEGQEWRRAFETWGEIQHIYRDRSRLSLDFPYTRMFEAAHDILAVGISLNAIALNFSREEIIHSIIHKKSIYALCFLNPDSTFCAEREQEEGYPEGGLAGLTRLNISNMQHIHNDISKRNPECIEQLKIMMYNLSPRFNIYIFDDELMTVQSYAYGRGEDTPTFVLKRQSRNGLFEFYSSTAKHIFEKAKPVNGLKI